MTGIREYFAELQQDRDDEAWFQLAFEFERLHEQRKENGRDRYWNNPEKYRAQSLAYAKANAKPLTVRTCSDCPATFEIKWGQGKKVRCDACAVTYRAEMHRETTRRRRLAAKEAA